MKCKTAELDGAALDAGVALAEGWRFHPAEDDGPLWYDTSGRFQKRVLPWSSMWEFGGPIIDREKIDLDHGEKDCTAFIHSHEGNENYSLLAEGSGESTLVAAMRCFVASKIGDEVDLP